MEALIALAQITQPADTVFHYGRETWTGHGGRNNAAIQLACQVNRIIFLVDASGQQLQQVARRLENGVTLLDSDVASHVPWKLCQGANQALVRSLRAISRERRLWSR